MDGNDVGVIQRRGGPRFLHETALSLGVGRLVRRQNLDGDQALQVGVAGLVDYPHPAFAEFLDDLVVQELASQHGGQSYTQNEIAML